MTTRIAVLASGGGSNLGAILEYLEQLGPRRAGSVELVASERAAAGALARARARGIPAVELENRARTAGTPLAHALDEHRIDLVVLAGYLRLIPPEVVRRYDGHMINVHPALLPAFGGPGMYGLRVHQAVIDSGARVSGATVHFVNDEFDRGAIIAQWPVPVFASDDAERLAARVLRVEHVLFPRVVNAVAGGRITASQPPRGVVADGVFTLSSRDDECLVADIERLVNG